MSAGQLGEWTIFYRRLDEPTEWKTLKYKRSDGVLVSAKTYDDVYKFNRFREAFDFAKELITKILLHMMHLLREYVEVKVNPFTYQEINN